MMQQFSNKEETMMMDGVYKQYKTDDMMNGKTERFIKTLVNIN